VRQNLSGTEPPTPWLKGKADAHNSAERAGLQGHEAEFWGFKPRRGEIFLFARAFVDAVANDRSLMLCWTSAISVDVALGPSRLRIAASRLVSLSAT